MLTLRTTPENDADTIRTLAGLKSGSQKLTDTAIKTVGILGFATRYVFNAVTENVNASVLSANLRTGVPGDYSDYNSIRNTDVNTFIVQALSVQQEELFRGAVLYYSAGLAMNFLTAPKSEESASSIVTHRYSEKNWKETQDELFASCDNQIKMIKDMYPDDAYPRKYLFSIFGIKGRS